MKVEDRQVQIMKKPPAIRAINHNNQITEKKKEWIVCLLLIKKDNSQIKVTWSKLIQKCNNFKS